MKRLFEMSLSKVTCCIRGCSNTPRRNIEADAKVKFYRFPESTLNTAHITFKRNQWINSVKNYVKNPKDWQPTKNTRICSAHFIDNKKSENPAHPSYLPKIFPGQTNLRKHTQSLQRFERLQQRRARKTAGNEELITNNKNNNNNNRNSIRDTEMEQGDNNSIAVEAQHHAEANDFDIAAKVACRSICCQTEDVSGYISSDPTYFFCNLSCSNGVSIAEVQVNISAKKTLDKVCEANLQPPRKTVKDFGCNPVNHDPSSLQCQGFHGIASIPDDDSLSSLTGVSFAIFNFLVNKLPDCKIVKVNRKTKLLITLAKLKTGLTFTALSVLFNIHRSTAHRIFINNLQQLNILLKNFIFWPSKATVQATLPVAFKRNYPKTRVIIDCTEVNTEVPPEVKQRVLMYSDYKHHHTVKFMVGCSPNGFISFVSKCYGGRASDCFITNDCGIVDLIEPGDVVLADKGFPQIKTEVEKKNAVFVMPPFCRDAQFTPEEVEETYNVASVRIHIERVNQRIKDFNIFTKVPVSLLPHIDEIVFVVCALVNIEKPIIRE